MGTNHIELEVILQPPCTTNRTSNADYSVVRMVSFPPAWFFSAQEASASLSQKISLGDKGIAEVTRSLCEVNVANAQAYDPRDEKKVKDTIRESVGFQAGASQNIKTDYD